MKQLKDTPLGILDLAPIREGGTAADERIVNSMIHDHAVRLRSCEIAAQARLG